MKNTTANMSERALVPYLCSQSLWAAGAKRMLIRAERLPAGSLALQLKWLVDEPYADADKIVLVMDNLNTHTTASLYKAFPPEEAYRIAQKLEIHYTPKHGSWLDMAEIELSALTVQCLLNVRIPTIEDLNKILSAWSQKRNFAQKGVSWHFTTDDARIKLSHLYPEIKF